MAKNIVRVNLTIAQANALFEAASNGEIALRDRVREGNESRRKLLDTERAIGKLLTRLKAVEAAIA